MFYPSLCREGIGVGLLRIEPAECLSETGGPVLIGGNVESVDAQGFSTLHILQAVIEEDALVGLHAIGLKGILEEVGIRLVALDLIAAEERVEIVGDGSAVVAEPIAAGEAHDEGIRIGEQTEVVVGLQLGEEIKSVHRHALQESEPAILRLVPTDVVATSDLSHTAAKLIGIDLAGLHVEEEVLLSVSTHVEVGIQSITAEAAESFLGVLKKHHSTHIRQNVLDHVFFFCELRLIDNGAESNFLLCRA